jgi:hypothetical protein
MIYNAFREITEINGFLFLRNKNGSALENTSIIVIVRVLPQ